MAEALCDSAQVDGWLGRVQSGEPAAVDELLRYACGRLEKLTRHLLRAYPGVKRWEQTDDVLQNALLRLLRALRAVQPASARDFFALASLQIRRELLDLARHYSGPEGIGARHASRAGDSIPDPSDLSHEPGALAEWSELHQHIDELPEDEREVVGLLFYQGLTQADAAAILKVTVRTVQRRWQAALLKLHGKISDQ